MDDRVGVVPRRDARVPHQAHAGDAPEQLALRDLLREDLATHGGQLISPGFWALAVHRLGTRVRARAPSRWLSSLDAAHDALATAIERASGIYIPLSTRIGRRLHLASGGATSLHARSIGNDVQIQRGARLGPLCHPCPGQDDLPVIEDGVQIEEGASILGSVTVGRGARVGAHTVVLQSVPAGTTIRALPGRAH